MISVNGHYYSSMAVAGTSVQRDIDVSIQRLSSGRRINAAKDDVAGMQISMRLSAKIKGLEQASKNAADAQSLIDTASTAINDAKKEVLRVKELAVQAANGTISSSDRDAINSEIKQRVYSIDRIASNTSWAGKQLLDGTFSGVKFQIGSETQDILTVNISSISSAQIGLANSVNNSSSHPGENNSDDVSIVANHPSASGNPSFIRFTNDTTAGMVHWFSNGGGIDPSADPDSKVEILGKEYTVSQGTISNKTSNLQSQLANDGISSSIVNLGGSLGTVLEVSATALSDYASAYSTSTFIYYGDPLQAVDGASNDSATLDAGYTHDTSNSSTPISVTDQGTASNLITLADTALAKLNAEDGKVGALSNRIDNIMSVNLSISTSLNQAIGGIADADYAKETAELAKNNILQQTSIQMSVISRKASESVRTLLNGDSFLHKQNFLY